MCSIPENKVKKYFRLVEVWVWCDICSEMIVIKINKKEIIEGLKEGIYKKEFRHKNHYHDKDDLNNYSNKEHAVYVYIDKKYNVIGVKSYFGESYELNQLKSSQTEGTLNVPVLVDNFSKRKFKYKSFTSDEIKLLKLCDGMNSIEQVAKFTNSDIESVRSLLNKFRDRNIIEIIKIRE